MKTPSHTDEPPKRADLAVLIPAWNPRGGLLRTLNSIAVQPVACEIYVVDDGSDPAIELPEHAEDKPVHLIRQEPNQGITAALNTGLRAILDAGFEFVARSDCADADNPERLQRQRTFLQLHPHVMLVGCSVRFDTPKQGLQYVYEAPPSAYDVKRRMHYSAAVVHPTCMFRADAFRRVGLYTDRYPHAEDYELFFRLLAHRLPIRNLPEVLVTAGYDPGSISMSNRRASLKSRLQLQMTYFDPWFAHSYIGLVQTLALWLLPYAFVCWLKSKPLHLRRE